MNWADGGGLPRLRTRVIIELEPEEKELLDRAMHKLRTEAKESLPDVFLERKHLLLYLAG